MKHFSAYQPLFLAVLASCLLGAATARGQANFQFSGGNGTPLMLSLAQPVAYTITTDQPFGSAPFFVFQGIGSQYATSLFLTGTITFTLNAGSPMILEKMYWGPLGNGSSVGTADAYLYGPDFPALPLGSRVVLNAGTLTSMGNSAAPPPVAGSYSTFIANANPDHISTNGVALAPEPSTWVLLAAGAGLLGFGVLRRRNV